MTGSDHSGKDGEICTVSRTGNFGGMSNGLRVLQSVSSSFIIGVLFPFSLQKFGCNISELHVFFF